MSSSSILFLPSWPFLELRYEESKARDTVPGLKRRVSFIPHVSFEALDTCEGPGTRSD